MTLKRCPVPLCGGEAVEEYGPFTKRPTGLVHCKQCGIWASVDNWQSLPRRSDPRPAPICPKCESEWVNVLRDPDGLPYTECDNCFHVGDAHATIDLAIDAWRPK